MYSENDLIDLDRVIDYTTRVSKAAPWFLPLAGSLALDLALARSPDTFKSKDGKINYRPAAHLTDGFLKAIALGTVTEGATEGTLSAGILGSYGVAAGADVAKIGEYFNTANPASVLFPGPSLLAYLLGSVEAPDIQIPTPSPGAPSPGNSDETTFWQWLYDSLFNPVAPVLP